MVVALAVFSDVEEIAHYDQIAFTWGFDKLFILGTGKEIIGTNISRFMSYQDLQVANPTLEFYLLMPESSVPTLELANIVNLQDFVHPVDNVCYVLGDERNGFEGQIIDWKKATPLCITTGRVGGADFPIWAIHALVIVAYDRWYKTHV